MSTTKLPSAPVPACTYLGPDGVTHWPAYSFEQMQQFARDAIAAHLAAQVEWPSEEDVAQVARVAFGDPSDHDFESVRAALQSVRPPVGVVSDADKYRRICAAFDDMKTSTSERFLECLGIHDADVCRSFDELFSASRHAPTDG